MNEKEVIIYLVTEEASDEDKKLFIEEHITDDNAVIIDITLFGEISGEEDSKDQITDTNGNEATISIILNNEQASKLSVLGNNNYYVLRLHNGEIERIEASLSKDDNDNYV